MPIPVVCVGNITLGGAGKTPTVIFLADYLKRNNIRVHIVSRGYRGKFKETILVNRRTHSAYDVGDEPLLISRYADVWVSKKKNDGIINAYRAGADLVLLDDGHQNFSIAKDINILVVDTDVNLKNEKIFPMGNLRESPRSAIDRADFLICIGSLISRKNLRESFLKHYKSKIIEGEFKPNIVSILKKRKIVAFCGIGRPEKFFSMLRKVSLEIIKEYTFPDHHFYSNTQLTRILNFAKNNNALVVTTEKDFIKIPSTFKNVFYSVNIKLHLQKDKKLLNEIKRLVS